MSRPRQLSFATLAILALVALIASRLIAYDARLSVVVLVGAMVLLVRTWLARRRMRNLLLSGDIARILAAWERSFRRATHPRTMNPLVTATAYAAYGFIDAARDALSRAAKGPAWEAAVEQRLFVEALLDVYEGERAEAMRKAEALESMPLPDVGFRMRRKIRLLRRGTSALARVFAHAGRATDEAILRDVARSSPLVHWAMRYARAVYFVDAGRQRDARALLANAPPWPAESAFRAFHDELASAVAEAAT